MRLWCAVKTAWGTLTLSSFWKSLLNPPLVIYSGHEFTEDVWGPPAPSPDPEYWPGLVEYNQSKCRYCGYVDQPTGWRPLYGG